MTKVLLISGSPTSQSRLNGVIQYASDYLQADDLEVEVLSVIDLPPEDLIFAKFQSEAVVAANKKVEEADVIIVSSQVYKASFTGVLKTYLDLLPQKAFENKIVFPLVLGGSVAHLLTIEYSFKPVLTVLGADVVLSGVYLVDSGISWGQAGKVEFDQATEERLIRALDRLKQEVQLRLAGQTSKALEG